MNSEKQPENEELTPEEELEDGIIELVDEDENVVKFRLLGVTEY